MFLCILSVFILTIKTQKGRHHRQRIELAQPIRTVHLAHHERTLQTPLGPRRKHHHQQRLHHKNADQNPQQQIRRTRLLTQPLSIRHQTVEVLRMQTRGIQPVNADKLTGDATLSSTDSISRSTAYSP